MICPFCKAENATSTLTTDLFETTTLMVSSPGHYDDRGTWVQGFDPNWTTRGYACSRGHGYEVTSRQGDPDEVRLISTLTHTPIDPHGSST